MQEATANALAKVNFTLDILDRRPDGYHEIRSIMQTISLSDTLTIIRSDGPVGIKLTVDGEHAGAAPVDDSNLVVKAVRAILTEVGINESVEIELTKRIPSQAGLGGGSSDAATALMLTDRLFNLGIPPEVMLRIAHKLGSDVPFFLAGGTCLVEGLGEKVAALDSKLNTDEGRKYLVVCKPNANVPTFLAYRELDNDREATNAKQNAPNAVRRVREPDWSPESQVLSPQDWGLGGRSPENGYLPLSNDFEGVILRLFPEIARVHAIMTDAGRRFDASTPLLCGSGASLFCLLDRRDQAELMAEALKEYNVGWVTTASTCRGGLE